MWQALGAFVVAVCLFGVQSALSASVAANSEYVKWVGRVERNGDDVLFDWEGVSATVTVTNFSWLVVDISDKCAGNGAVGGGSRWRVDMSPPQAGDTISASHHRIQTFYSGAMVPTYYLFNNPGQGCDPCGNAEGRFTGTTNFTLTRMTESRVGGCTTDAGLSVLSFRSDGEFSPAPPITQRRIEFIGDSITAGDLNSGSGATECANDPWNNDVTMTSGAQLCALWNIDCMYTAWGGIKLGDPKTNLWGMQQLYPHTFSSHGVDAYGSWDFRTFMVDAVVINLGTNDDPQAPALEWQNQYVQFVTRLVKDYYVSPNLVVFLGWGPITNRYEPFVRNVTQTLQTMGIDAHNLDLMLSHPDTGCYGHPSAADNAEIVNKTQSYIRSVMGW